MNTRQRSCFTDGHETADKTVAAAAGSINSRVFAVGLGTPDQLNPGTLSDVANGTGGYVLLTGNPGPDDQIRLQKYFAQVLAGATNAAIVVDPDGFVPFGGKVEIPFDLTEADIRADVIVLSDAASAFTMRLITPDGNVLRAGDPGVEELVADTYRFMRVTPTVAAPGGNAGRWTAVLAIDKRRVRGWLARLRKRLDNNERADEILKRVMTAMEVHGLPFTLTVQARSALHLNVDLTQQSRRPGEPGLLRASLTDSGIPLVVGARVDAHVTRPDGSAVVVTCQPDESGYSAMIPTSVAGAYDVRVVAEGDDLRGQRFTREELRSLAVWARGDEATPPTLGGGDDERTRWCELLRCLLEQDSIRESISRRDIDPDEILRCLKRVCRD